MRCVIGVLPAIAAAGLFAFAGPAAAESGPPNVWAAVAQYIEMIPTSSGPAAAGAPGPTKRLPPSLAAEFARSGGVDAQALKTLVTSSGWGADTSPRARPQNPKPRPAENGRHGPGNANEPTSPAVAVPFPQETTSLSGSVGGALTDGGRATFALAAVLSLLTAAVLFRLGRSRR
jgi:hypothetical protein